MAIINYLMKPAQNRKISSFSNTDLIINDSTLRTTYRQRTDDDKFAIHWGQLKLMLSEIEFLSIYWDINLIPNPTCVYAGAAPGIHITLLSQMFPKINFDLYDPADFKIKETPRIKIFNKKFDDDVATLYSNRNDVFFISDIRTADYKKIQQEALTRRGINKFEKNGKPIGPYLLIKEALAEAASINEDQIWSDMTMQEHWVHLINPAHALIKFRLPYPLNGEDIKVKYLKGIVYWQIWPPQTSTETRLKPVKNSQNVYESADWNIIEYEQWCFHHNTVDREQTFYINPFTGTNDPIDFPELLNDYDSVAHASILKLYFEKFGATTDIYSNA